MKVWKNFSLSIQQNMRACSRRNTVEAACESTRLPQQKHQQLALKGVRDGAQLRKAVRLLGFNKQEMAERTIWLQIYHIRLEKGRTITVLQRPLGRFHCP